MKQFFKDKKITTIFTVFGLLGGFLYWRFIGCVSGTCPIQSVWHWSTLWGGLAGYLSGEFIQDIIQKTRRKEAEKE